MHMSNTAQTKRMNTQTQWHTDTPGDLRRHMYTLYYIWLGQTVEKSNCDIRYNSDLPHVVQ